MLSFPSCAEWYVALRNGFYRRCYPGSFFLRTEKPSCRVCFVILSRVKVTTILFRCWCESCCFTNRFDNFVCVPKSDVCNCKGAYHIDLIITLILTDDRRLYNLQAFLFAFFSNPTFYRTVPRHTTRTVKWRYSRWLSIDGSTASVVGCSQQCCPLYFHANHVLI